MTDNGLRRQQAGYATERAVAAFCAAQGLTVRAVGVRGRPLLGKDGTVHWGTGQAKGLPDFLVTGHGLAFFVEVKGPRATLNTAQRALKAELDAAHWDVVVGDWQAVARYLRDRGVLAIEEQGGRVVGVRKAG